MSFLERIKRLKERINKFSDGRFIYVLFSGLFYYIFYGYSLGSYFDYEFSEKSHHERIKYIGERERVKIEKRYNKASAKLTDKALFNDSFKDYLKRDYLYVLRADFKSFTEFIKKHNSFVIKRNWLCEGLGIEKYTVSENEDLEKLFNKLKSEDSLIEEIIIQNDSLQELNPTSVNTVRISTWFDGRTTTVVAATLRIGNKGTCTDNLHSGGIAVPIDINTGITKSLAFNNLEHDIIKHPETGKILIGFQIPNWDEAIETVSKCSKAIPENKWVGWDIAILPRGVAIVEGNCNQSLDLIQINAQGLRTVLKRLSKTDD